MLSFRRTFASRMKAILGKGQLVLSNLGWLGNNSRYNDYYFAGRGLPGCFWVIH
jgi:hypothetical protein